MLAAVSASEKRMDSNAITPPLAARIQWVNVAKGLGIILMVFGHVGRGIVPPKEQASGGAAHLYWLADEAIYAFHMPLFFFLSGLFVERGARRSAGVFFDSKVRTILYPYFLWATIQCLFVRAASGYAKSQVDAWR